MKFAKIEDVIEVNPRAKGLPLNEHDPVSFVPMAAVSEQSRSVVSAEVRPYGEVAKGYTYFEEGDVIIAKITPCFENGKMALAEGLPHPIAFGSTEYHVFRPGEEIFNHYLFYVLQSPFVLSAGASQMKGAAGQKRVPAEFFKNLKIPLPPLEEQKRIAAILDAADDLRTKRRESLAQLDALLQSTFLDLFGDPVTNPKGWESATIEDVVAAGDRVNYGVVQPGDDVQGGAPLIRVGDFISGDLNFSKIKFIDPAIDSKYSRSKLNGTEILISCVGSIGNICKVPVEAIGHNIARAVARVPLINSVNRDFMVQMLRTKRVQDYFIKETRTVSQPTLNISLIKSTPILLPPLEAQMKFSEFVKEAETQWGHYREQAAELDTLFASLQSRAFRGEL